MKYGAVWESCPFLKVLKYYPVAIVLSGEKICTGEEGKMKGGAKKG